MFLLQDPDLCWKELLVFHTLFSLLVSSLMRCLCSSKSYWIDDTLAQPAKHILRKKDQSIRQCRKCHFIKPDRAHHCRQCGCCILKMDHHCVFLNKCIGLYNQKSFLLFLFYAALTCTYLSMYVFVHFIPTDSALVSDLLAITLRATHHSNWWDWAHKWLRIVLAAPAQVCLIGFTSFCLGVALSLFFLLHLFFAARNVTTLEYLEGFSIEGLGNPFSVGLLTNLSQVFGTFDEAWCWFLPIAPTFVHESRGLAFPNTTNKELKKRQ